MFLWSVMLYDIERLEDILSWFRVMTAPIIA
jgi:hypothetical protein